MTDRSPIPWALPVLWGNERAYADRALASTWISGGVFVDQLERSLAELLGVPHVIAVANGTSALHLACLGLGIRPRDEVIVPGFGFMAAANIALHVGATPVFAEVDPDSWCMDPADVRRRLSSRTKLVIAVHTYGNMCDMEPLLALGADAGIPVLEDAAESFGSRLGPHPAGSMGRAGTLSFHATKTITTGEGGAVLTADPDLDRTMRLFRSHGMSKRRYWHEVPGHNFRLTNIQAAIGCAQLEHFDEIVDHRTRIHSHYRERLASEAGLRLQRFRDDVVPVLWAFAVRLDRRRYPQGRDAVMAALAEALIETRPGFYAASEMPLYGAASLPISEEVAKSVLVLPTHPSLSQSDLNRICDELLALRA